MSSRNLGATEYNSAIQLVDLAEDRFPAEEMWDAYNSNRIDLCSAIIEVASRNVKQGTLTDLDFLNKKVEFSKEMNKLYKQLGIFDMMLEQLELNKVLTQIEYEYNLAIAHPDKPLFAAADMTLRNIKFEQAMSLPRRKHIMAIHVSFMCS